VVECLTLLLRIWEVPGSNLGPETGYPDVFYGCPQSLQENAGKYLKNEAASASPQILFDSSLTYYPNIRRCIGFVSEKSFDK
jgi:hypothetical protein